MDRPRPEAGRGRFGKIIWWVGLVSTGVLLATLFQGFLVEGANRLRLHLFLALVATLAIFFSHLWIAIYLRILRRELGRPDGERELAGGQAIPTRSLPWTVTAFLLVLGSFLLGPVALQGLLPMKVHALVGFSALGTQLASLWAERRDLGASDLVLARLYAAEGH